MKNLKKAREEAVDLLRKLIEIPSVSREENKTADLIESYLRANGVEVFRHGNNVWAGKWDSSKPLILLNSHHDTVKPVSGWKRDPFAASEENGRIYGLGSNDAGASLVSLLQVFLVLQGTEQSYDVIFLASAEEEVSGKNGVESALTVMPSIDLAIVGEPTQMQAAVAEKGLLVCDVMVSGKSGHAARNEGVNAIYEAVEVIDVLRGLDFPLKSKWLGEVKISVTQINAGVQHNVVPDQCNLVLDIRTTDQYSNEEVLKVIRNNVKADVKARSLRLGSSGIDINHPLVKACVKHGRELYGSPTMSDQALMTFPSLKMGPGDSARSHTADEYIVIEEIYEAIDLYIDILDGLKL